MLRGFYDLSERVPGVDSEIKASLAFVVILTTLGTILSLPTDWYRNFVLEEKHGFNKVGFAESAVPSTPADITADHR